MPNPTRRDFLRGFAGATTTGVLSPALFAAARPARKLNVLFLAVDDLRPELGCYGKKHILSPHIDQLASRGLLFERAYCQQAVCGATRASLLSGMRPNSSKVHGNQTPLSTVHDNLATIPKHFRDNGYETISLGKIYHHKKTDDPTGWSAPEWVPQGEWVGRGYLSDEGKAATEAESRRLRKLRDAAVAKAKTAAEKKRLSKRYKLGVGPPTDCADVPDNAYPDGKIADKAIAEMQRLKDKPFFLAVGFMKPHLPFNAPKKYWDLYRRSEIDLADNPFLPKGSPSYAASNWGELRKYVGMPRKGLMPDDDARKLIHGYYACVSYMDAQVGRVLAELDRLDLRDSTVVILWGDHGWKLGDHGEWCKHTNWEIDTHVPMIVSAPGYKGGLRTDALSEFVDIYPSLADLCGLDIPAHCEGASFVPLMKDPKRPWKSAAFSQWPRGGKVGYAMRTDRYRLVRWKEAKTGKVAATELYDQQVDPKENVNIAARADSATLVKKLSAQLEAGWKAAKPRRTQ